MRSRREGTDEERKRDIIQEGGRKKMIEIFVRESGGRKIEKDVQRKRERVRGRTRLRRKRIENGK